MLDSSIVPINPTTIGPWHLKLSKIHIFCIESGKMETYVDGKRENNLMFRLWLKGREKYEESKKSNSGYGLHRSLDPWNSYRL